MSYNNAEILNCLCDWECGGILQLSIDQCETDDASSREAIEDDLLKLARSTCACHLFRLAFHMNPVPELARDGFNTATSAANLSVAADTRMSSSPGSEDLDIDDECARNRT